MSKSVGAKTPKHLLGAWEGPRPATAKDQETCQLVKLDVEAKLNQTFQTFRAITAATQVAEGMNYCMKILVDDEKYLNVFIFQPFEGHVERVSVQYPRKKDDQLECFRK